MSETFDADWLALREPADAAARSARLAERAARWLARRERPLRIVDLGAGAGNNAAWLAPQLPGPQHWRLVDHDETLLSRGVRRFDAIRDSDGERPVAEAACRDLANADAALPDGTDLATASALFDLVSSDWVEALAGRCAAIGCAALWTLSIDGDWHFTAAGGERRDAEADVEMRDRLTTHQHRDKGLGRALGGDAPAVLSAAFERCGYAVHATASPWRLRPGSSLAPVLVDGWRDALLEQSPDAEAAIRAWWTERRRALLAGELGVVVGHVDLWAEPVS